MILSLFTRHWEVPFPLTFIYLYSDLSLCFSYQLLAAGLYDSLRESQPARQTDWADDCFILIGCWFICHYLGPTMDIIIVPNIGL